MRLFPSFFSSESEAEKLPFCQSTPAERGGEKGWALQRSSGMEGCCLCFTKIGCGSVVPRSKASFWLGTALAFRFLCFTKIGCGSAVPRPKASFLAWNCTRLSLFLRTERTVQKKGDDYACIHVRRTREIRIKGKAASGVAGRAGCHRTGDVGKHLYQ